MIKNNQSLNIRPADDSDSMFIRDLSDGAFRLFGEYGDTVLKWFESGYSTSVIIEFGHKKAGFAMLSEPFGRSGDPFCSELLAIAVSTEYRGSGLGTLLVDRITDMAFSTGVNVLFLHTATDNANAVKLFKASGFKIWQEKKKFYPMGQDAFMMAKKFQLI